MTKPNSTEIVFIVDRSGSMQKIAADMRGGFDAFIKKQREVTGECRVSLAQFDDEYEMVYEGRPLIDVPSLKLEPRGSTALLDAIGRTIATTGARLANMAEEDRPSSVFVVIITDGNENASREYSQQRVFDMISHQRTKYAWEFIFLGSNQDAIATACSLGVSASNAVTYDSSAIGTAGLMRGLGANIASSRRSGYTKGAVYSQADYDKSVDDLSKRVDDKTS